MNLSDEQIELIQSSFARIGPIEEEAGRYFYARLFEIAPEFRPMFRGETAEHGRKLMEMLAAIVRGLGDAPTLSHLAGELAVRHVGYGVEPEHYRPVGQALVDTLHAALGNGFTPEARAAWIDAYDALSETMIATAHPSAA